LHGDAVRYYANCQVNLRGHFDRGNKEGKWGKWAENGAKIEEGTYQNDHKNGVWTTYREGQKEREGPFVIDVADGKVTEWFANGSKFRDYNMVKGVREGADVAACEKKKGEWDVDLKERREGCRVSGRTVGVWTGYFGDGKVKYHADYGDGVGTWTL